MSVTLTARFTSIFSRKPGQNTNKIVWKICSLSEKAGWFIVIFELVENLKKKKQSGNVTKTFWNLLRGKRRVHVHENIVLKQMTNIQSPNLIFNFNFQNSLHPLLNGIYKSHRQVTNGLQTLNNRLFGNINVNLNPPTSCDLRSQ